MVLSALLELAFPGSKPPALRPSCQRAYLSASDGHRALVLSPVLEEGLNGAVQLQSVSLRFVSVMRECLEGIPDGWERLEDRELNRVESGSGVRGFDAEVDKHPNPCVPHKAPERPFAEVVFVCALG